MNYLDKRAQEIYFAVEPEGSLSEEYKILFRIYAVLSFAKGLHTTLRDVHDAWSAWCASTYPEHRSLIPFEDLSPEVQELDRIYAEAIWKCSDY